MTQDRSDASTDACRRAGGSSGAIGGRLMRQWPVLALCAAVATAGMLVGCGGEAERRRVASRPAARRLVSPRISLPDRPQRIGTAIVILIDTSGSMAARIRAQDGTMKPKHEIAEGALERIVDYTARWKASRADRVLDLGMYSFSSSPAVVLGMGEFDAKAARSALERIPRPGGGTAIGQAIVEGFRALYGSGCITKHLVCITDGENTSGVPPDRVSRQLYDQTEGAVEMHFVAFDTSAKGFNFLSQVNGHVVEAVDGAELRVQLKEIYEKRILAEAMPLESE
ncbi:MAG: VWA domain-containing protein [Phycisphaerae bacterium]|nr:VWA domain-containing protein [Phycisphaerae bacterium]